MQVAVRSDGVSSGGSGAMDCAKGSPAAHGEPTSPPETIGEIGSGTNPGAAAEGFSSVRLETIGSLIRDHVEHERFCTYFYSPPESKRCSCGIWTRFDEAVSRETERLRAELELVVAPSDAGGGAAALIAQLRGEVATWKKQFESLRDAGYAMMQEGQDREVAEYQRTRKIQEERDALKEKLVALMHEILGCDGHTCRVETNPVGYADEAAEYIRNERRGRDEKHEARSTTALSGPVVTSIEEPGVAGWRLTGSCFCGSSKWCVSPTRITCMNCRRLWGRVNGAWVYDHTSAPRTESAK